MIKFSRILSLMMLISVLLLGIGVQPAAAAAQKLVPDPPTQVTASYICDDPSNPHDTTRVVLNWTASPNTTGYNVYRRSTNSNAWSTLVNYSAYPAPAYNSGQTMAIESFAANGTGEYIYNVCAVLPINGVLQQACIQTSIRIGPYFCSVAPQPSYILATPIRAPK